MTDDQKKSQIRALLEERTAYERAGRDDRAEQVSDQLRQLGHEAAKPAARAEKRDKVPMETR